MDDTINFTQYVLNMWQPTKQNDGPKNVVYNQNTGAMTYCLIK